MDVSHLLTPLQPNGMQLATVAHRDGGVQGPTVAGTFAFQTPRVPPHPHSHEESLPCGLILKRSHRGRNSVPAGGLKGA